jgi:branched-subunit amino acid ABC-type transport system permease component
MFTEIVQHVINGLVVGSIVALPALGLTLIFSVLGFLNFSVAAQMTLGAYAGWLVNSKLHWPLVPALLAAFLAAGAAGVIADRLALAPIRRRPQVDTPLMMAIASIALNLVLENALRFGFGSALNSFELPLARDMEVAGVRFAPQQLSNLATALTIAFALAAFFTLTRWGKAMRAVADNRDLARLKGIDPGKLSSLATFLGMGLAGIGGALLAIDTSVDPSSGSRLLLVVFAGSVLGGLTSLPGAVLGALLIGVAGEMSLLVLSPVYQSGTAFVAILLVLLMKPSGLFSGTAAVRK